MEEKMEKNLINICYEGSSGESEIRTIYLNDILHFSLADVFVALNKENRAMGESNPTRYIPNLIRQQIKELDDDEHISLPHHTPSKGLEDEIFITQPGLNRVMGSDDSPAGRRFQRWLYHEVVPSLTKHGTYPPPLISQDSDVKRLVKTLLMEIEQREESERKNQAKFYKHEKMLNQLGSELHSIKSNQVNIEFKSVTEFCDSYNIGDTNKQLIFGWCIKICAEKGEPSKKEIRGTEEIVLFPIHVLIAAAKQLQLL